MNKSMSHCHTWHQTDALQLEAIDVHGRLGNTAYGIRCIMVAGERCLDDHVTAALQVCMDVFGIRTHLLFLICFAICKLCVFDSVTAQVAAEMVHAAKIFNGVIFDGVSVILRQLALINFISRTFGRLISSIIGSQLKCAIDKHGIKDQYVTVGCADPLYVI
jgi:hypothetical protein